MEELQLNQSKTKELVLLAMFIAIEIMLFIVPFLGFIPIGPLRATTMHIPVIVAAIVLGRKQGVIVGFVFGLLSLVLNTIQPTATSFIFSPFISGNILSLFEAILPRMAIGYVAGTIYQALKNKNQFIAMIVSAFLGALTNTILVLGGIYVLFGVSYAKALGKSFSELLPYLLGIIATNGMLEAVVGTIIALALSKVLINVYRKEKKYA